MGLLPEELYQQMEKKESETDKRNMEISEVIKEVLSDGRLKNFIQSSKTFINLYEEKNWILRYDNTREVFVGYFPDEPVGNLSSGVQFLDINEREGVFYISPFLGGKETSLGVLFKTFTREEAKSKIEKQILEYIQEPEE